MHRGSREQSGGWGYPPIRTHQDTERPGVVAQTCLSQVCHLTPPGSVSLTCSFCLLVSCRTMLPNTHLALAKPRAGMPVVNRAETAGG